MKSHSLVPASSIWNVRDDLSAQCTDQQSNEYSYRDSNNGKGRATLAILAFGVMRQTTGGDGFLSATFDTVTFIANLNHAPRSQRDAELQEAFRVLKLGENIIITMSNFLAEILVHKLVALYDRVFVTALDIDGQRGMNVEEDYYLRPREIRQRLRRAGFIKISREFFLTQWCLNSLFIGWKPHQSESRAL